MFSDKITGEPYTVWDHAKLAEARRLANRSDEDIRKDNAVHNYNGLSRLQRFINWVFRVN